MVRSLFLRPLLLLSSSLPPLSGSHFRIDSPEIEAVGRLVLSWNLRRKEEEREKRKR